MATEEKLVARARKAIEIAEAMGVRGKHNSSIYNVADELVSALTAAEARVAQLETALKPFALEADGLRNHTGDNQSIRLYARAGDIRAARTALSQSPGRESGT